MKHRTFIEFTNPDGTPAGKVELVYGSSRGNRHYNPRRPNGATCGAVTETTHPVTGVVTRTQCGEPWKPLCPNFKCSAAQAVRNIERAERQFGSKFGAGGKRFRSQERQAA